MAYGGLLSLLGSVPSLSTSPACSTARPKGESVHAIFFLRLEASKSEHGARYIDAGKICGPLQWSIGSPGVPSKPPRLLLLAFFPISSLTHTSTADAGTNLFALPARISSPSHRGTHVCFFASRCSASLGSRSCCQTVIDGRRRKTEKRQNREERDVCL